MMGLEKPIWADVDAVVREMATEIGVDGMLIVEDVDDLEAYVDLLFKRTFFNLMDNSLRHGGDVSSIRISSSRSGPHAVIVYEDDGGDVPVGSKEEVFELGRGSNTGLGLYMARRVLSITHITIVEDGMDGARFVITVPQGIWRSEDL